MVFVPEGRFWRGCGGSGLAGSGQPDCRVDPETEVLLDVPYRELELSAFWIDKFELTTGEFMECGTSGVCAAPGNATDGRTWDEYVPPEDLALPITGITWDQARIYCEWRSKRLPTEAEWEKAARGVDGNIFPWGNERPTCDQTNVLFEFDYHCPETTPDARSTVPVDARPEDRSPYGAIGMHGNVQEFVWDWAAKTYYDEAPDRDPPGPAAPADGSLSEQKIVRGSYVGAGTTRISRRGWFTYDHEGVGRVGFRCASSLAPSELP